jgi:hypothetical protein
MNLINCKQLKKLGKKMKRTNPELWEACKQEAVRKLGKFSARAMQHAVALYKARGGGYEGVKPEGTFGKWARPVKDTEE